MECHYKVLGVELNADDDQIKKAYRKAALKYHPDKNLHCLEEATEKFRLVQAAYDVLSDPQERAWYDRHREEILHRKKYENYKDNSLDLWDFFSPSAYKGFGNDENGFYSVYGDVFRKIDAEDEPFRSDDSDHEPMPCFGDADSDYDEVVHVFYSEWQAYCTHLSFVWENQYDVKEAPNRRVARIIEKENKKERDKHKKKRNELVRELVAFVRKRDPRVKAHKVELENLAAEKAAKAEEHRASVLRQRVEKAAEYDEANKEEMMKHHERVAELENLMKDEFGFSSEDEKDSQDEQDSEEEGEYKDELFCVACNKLFKSEMGLRNHEKSKKHKESVNRLREEMKNDESIDDDYVKRNQEEISHDHDIEEIKSGGKMSKRQKKQKRQQQKLLDNLMAAEPIKVEDFDDANVKTVSYDKTTNEGLSQESPDCNDEPVSETLPQEDGTVTIDESENMVSEPTHSDSTTTTTTSNTKKAKHKKQKQQKPANSHPDSNSESLGCGKCCRVFQSRNKLFQHLKQTGHSLPLENGKSSKRKEKRSRN